MITTIITDLDGTLVDTFQANLCAYQKAFAEVGLSLPEEKYLQCFGLRFEAFMKEVGITDDKTAGIIKQAKKDYYPEFFHLLRPNRALIELISSFKEMGGKTAVASTANKDNLMNVLNYLGVSHIFIRIFAGLDVTEGKPSPEIYIKAMDALESKPEETLIFEDSEVGIQAAKASGASVIVVPKTQFE